MILLFLLERHKHLFFWKTQTPVFFFFSSGSSSGWRKQHLFFLLLWNKTWFSWTAEQHFFFVFLLFLETKTVFSLNSWNKRFLKQAEEEQHHFFSLSGSWNKQKKNSIISSCSWNKPFLKQINKTKTLSSFLQKLCLLPLTLSSWTALLLCGVSSFSWNKTCLC